MGTCVVTLPHSRDQVRVQHANIAIYFRFIGASSWFRAFIPEYAEKAAALTSVLQGTKFAMTDAAKNSVEHIKEALCNMPVLILPDKSKTMIMYTDASKVAIAGVIGHQIEESFHPIQYASKVLSKSQRNYPSWKLEFLAVKHFVSHWRYYLLDHQSIIYTDMQAITSDRFRKKPTSGVIIRWLLSLADYDIIFRHKSGKNMQLPDMLSRDIEMPTNIDELFKFFAGDEDTDSLGATRLEATAEDERVISAVNISNDQEVPLGDLDNPFPPKRDTDGYWAQAQRADITCAEVRNWFLNGQKPDKKEE